MRNILFHFFKANPTLTAATAFGIFDGVLKGEMDFHNARGASTENRLARTLVGGGLGFCSAAIMGVGFWKVSRMIGGGALFAAMAGSHAAAQITYCIKQRR